jgi:hypothetical protein
MAKDGAKHQYEMVLPMVAVLDVVDDVLCCACGTFGETCCKATSINRVKRNVSVCVTRVSVV